MRTIIRIFISFACAGIFYGPISAYSPSGYRSDCGPGDCFDNAYLSIYNASYCGSPNNPCYSYDSHPGNNTYYCGSGIGNGPCPHDNNNSSYYYNGYYNDQSSFYSQGDNCSSGNSPCSRDYRGSGINNSYADDGTPCVSAYPNGQCNFYSHRNQTQNQTQTQYGYDGLLNWPDLVVQSVYQNTPDGHIIAQVCNRGSDMTRVAHIRTIFVIDDIAANADNNVWLSRGQCIDSPVYVSPSTLGIASQGDYFANVVTDADNNVEELDESNNILARTLSLNPNRIRRSYGQGWEWENRWGSSGSNRFRLR